MLFFGISTVIGVPLLSSFQITQIKGSTWADWATSLGTSFGPAIGVFILVSLIAFFVTKPLVKILKKAEVEDLSIDEKKKACKVLKTLNIITIVSLLVGYPVGNGSSIIIKTLAGKVNYNFVDITIIFVLIILYALLAIQYSVVCFNSFSQRIFVKLKIHSLEGIKTHRITDSLSLTISCIVVIVGWHVFCSGYSAVKNAWTLSVFLRKGLYSLVMSLCISVPLFIMVLDRLRKRLDMTVNQIRDLRVKGDLVSRLSIGTFDDFGLVMAEMNYLMNFLQESVNKLKVENLNVGNDASSLVMISESSSAGMSQIVSSFDDMQGKNEEKDRLLESAKNNIDKLSEDAQKISVSMEQQAAAEKQNAESITLMVNNFSEIIDLTNKAKVLSNSLSESSLVGAEEVEKTQKIVQFVNEKSKAMIDVVKVIQQVASQTNLLAMNAAIEASHAGEAGTGFSVVAGEIRNLAESTQKQVKSIKDLISEISVSIEQGTDSMNETKSVFDTIRTGITEQGSVVESISESVNSQVSGARSVLEMTKDISDRINSVNELIQNQSNYTRDIQSGIDEVFNLSVDVNKSMNESAKVLTEFSSSIDQVKSKAHQNQSSVQSITGELDKFKV